jgi:hypothetical protein
VLSPTGSFCAVIPFCMTAATVTCWIWQFAILQVQLQQVGTLSKFCFSGYSRWRCPPPHHRQCGGCLQCSQMWPKH